MVSLAEQVAEKIQEFPVEQQKEVLHYVEFIAMKLGIESNSAQSTQVPLKEPRISMAEAMRKYAGCLDGGPSDLSTNQAYMEGFGET